MFCVVVMEGDDDAVVGGAEAPQVPVDDGRGALSSKFCDETLSILETCKMFIEFLISLNVRGTEGITRAAIAAISNLKLNMAKFIEDNPDLNVVEEKGKGARPKIFKRSDSETVEAVVPEISSSDSETSSSGCVSSSGTSTVSDSDTSIRVKKRKSKLRNITKQGRSDSKYESRKMNIGITRLLKKIDSRQLPKLEKFSEESLQSLSTYLVKFENYCKESFRSPKDLWINELEYHLKRRILDTFSSIRDFNDSYEDLKNKLLKSFNDNKEIRKKLYRQKFENARPKPKESMYMFSVRLEGLFKGTVPAVN